MLPSLPWRVSGAVQYRHFGGRNVHDSGKVQKCGDTSQIAQRTLTAR